MNINPTINALATALLQAVNKYIINLMGLSDLLRGCSNKTDAVMI